MSVGECCSFMRRELQLRNLGFKDVHPARFCYSQWRTPALVYFTYRLILAVYCIFWLSYSVWEGESVKVPSGVDIPAFAFLTIWTYFVLTLYLVVHFVACFVYACGRGGRLCICPSHRGHRQLFHELQPQPGLWGSTEYSFIPGIESDDETQASRAPLALSCIYRLVWILYNVASVACLMVTVIFWTLLWPQINDDGFPLINFQLHGVTSIIIFIEHLISAAPWRLLHIVYPVMYGILYVAFSVIYYAVDNRHILYPGVLDWSQPGKTTGVIFVTLLIVLPVIQLFFLGIYKLRLFIYNKVNHEE